MDENDQPAEDKLVTAAVVSSGVVPAEAVTVVRPHSIAPSSALPTAEVLPSPSAASSLTGTSSQLLQTDEAPAETSTVTGVVAEGRSRDARRIGLFRRSVSAVCGIVVGLWNFVSLLILLACVAALPVLQLASLGYLLNSAGRLAAGRRWSEALPGTRLAGRCGSFALLAGLLWLPVWLATDVAYTAQLLEPGSGNARFWRWFASGVAIAWIVHIGWAAIRGGRIRDLLWPAPWRFARDGWRWSTWADASNRLYDFYDQFRLPTLWWIGFRGAVGALVWLAVPAGLMIIGLRSDAAAGPAFLVGLLGALLMTLVVFHLPALQVRMAAENRWRALFELRSVRHLFAHAPWASMLSLWLLCLLSVPLYLLRIEPTPASLLWAPALVFVVFMLPAKILIGAAMGYAAGRMQAGKPRRHWMMRWSARSIGLVGVLFYLGSLYVAQLAASDGVWVMWLQHAFLVPAPLISS